MSDRMPKRTCSIDKCESAVVARGWCGKHYQRWKAHGTPTGVSWPTVCTVEGCDRHVKARGWCFVHYQRWRKRGTVVDRITTSHSGPRACANCKAVKGRDEFYPRQSRGPDARHSRCKACESNRVSDYNKTNLEVGRRWREANPERVTATQWRWRRSPRGREVLKALEERRDPELRATKASRRRARLRGVESERILRSEVLRRHGTQCGICQKLIHEGTPIEIDHIVPISRGGSHTYANVQPSHRLCNQRKGAKLLHELTWIDELAPATPDRPRESPVWTV